MAPQALCHLLVSSPASSFSLARLIPLLPFLLVIFSGVICSFAEASPPQGLRRVEINEETGTHYLQSDPNPDLSDHDSGNAYLAEQDLSSDSPNDCYALEFSKNMSTLLTEATGMLGRVKNSRERSWLKAFIRRLASLADNLLEHPEVRQSQCLRYRNQGSRTNRLSQSTENFTVKNKNNLPREQVLLPHKTNSRRSHVPGHVEGENHLVSTGGERPQNESSAITKPETNQRDFVTEEMSKIDGGRKLESTDDLVQQLRIGPPGITDSTIPQQELPRGMIDVKVWRPPNALYHQSTVGSLQATLTSPRTKVLKSGQVQKLLTEMSSQVKQLKDLGGTEEDILNLWKETGQKSPLPKIQLTPSPEEEHDIHDFSSDGQGAAAIGELQAGDSPHDMIEAPSFLKVESTVSSIPAVSSSSDLDKVNDFSEESYEENQEDDLVRQLQEEKFLSEKRKYRDEKLHTQDNEKTEGSLYGSPVPSRSPAFPLRGSIVG